jgi:hypothetical protein
VAIIDGKDVEGVYGQFYGTVFDSPKREEKKLRNLV